MNGSTMFIESNPQGLATDISGLNLSLAMDVDLLPSYQSFATNTLINCERAETYSPNEFNYKFPTLDEDVLKYMERNPKTRISIQIYKDLEDSLQSLNIESIGEINIIHDVESPEWKGIAIEFKIYGKSYNEILDLWDQLSTEISGKFDPKSLKNIEVILSKE